MMDNSEYENPQEFLMQKPKRKDTKLNREKFVEYLKREPQYALLELTRANGGLKNFLQDKTKSTDVIQLAIRCFSHACGNGSLELEKNKLLSHILDSKFMSTDLTIYSWSGSILTEDFVEACVFIMLKLLSKMPTDSVKEVTLLSQRLSEIDKWNEVTSTRLSTVRNLIHSEPNESQQQRPTSQRPRSGDDDIPPEDFRILTTIPLENDLDVNIQPFLRKNRIDARYDNCDQYLDIQFRLLREDLFFPLRENIGKYQSHEGNKGQSLSSIKVYLNVRLVRPICYHNALGYRISFDVNKMPRVNWDTCRRLIYGSLLCLSKDNFKTCVYATVVNKDTKDVKNGLIDVCFEFEEAGELNDFVQDNRKSIFAMVESPSYYEPYKHVLLAMKNIDERRFPFLRYVVDCETDIYRPAYLRRNPQTRYDLRPVADPSYKIQDSTDIHIFNTELELDVLQEVDIFNDASWPDNELLHLDLSQSIALRHALSREFAIIQGPPGTGKTHLGLNILKVLLHNKSVWQSGCVSTPIVVICYSNHALDQFLSGALNFFDGIMVRVGSRIQMDEIKQYSISNHRSRSREARQVSQAIHNSRVQLRLEMETLKKEIERIAVYLQIAQRDIIRGSCLQQEAIMTDIQYRQLNLDNDESELLRWLGIQDRLQVINDLEIDPHVIGDNLEMEEEGDDELEELDVLLPLGDMRLMDDDDDDLFAGNDVEVDIIRMNITLLDVSTLDDIHMPDHAFAAGRQQAEQKRTALKKLKKQLQYKLSSDECMTEEEANGIPQLRRIKYKDRWRLYKFWTRTYVDKVVLTLIDKEKEYELLTKRYKDVLLHEDKAIIKGAALVGLTTTAAARYQSILADIGPKVIIFEEAAEVLEGHIVVNLCQSCEHAILIGDHKQLQPNPTVHKLAKDYKMDISLFERLINNQLPFDILKFQHRMRPEISYTMKAIYQDLEDHEVVKSYENIRGIDKNIAFINHSHPDECDEETKSYANKFEADYLKELCKYLMKQGYQKSRITILSMYSGQNNYLTSIMKKANYPNLRIATVDSYQGQENDIVLLSLVRSSNDDSIGFLAKNNRICVAFSRAKMGFYVIGNFEHLKQHSPLLNDIVIKASRKHLVSDGLQLGCQKHKQTRVARVPEDFNSVGDCMEPCIQRLRCGHSCQLLCHSDDSNHERTRCLEQCVKKCNNGHQCKEMCYQECSPCMVFITKTLPRCGHEQKVPCSEEPWKSKCEIVSTKTLPCGHKGQGKCSPLLQTNCMEKIQVTRPCGHTTQVACHEEKSDSCYHPCATVLECEHLCNGTCSGCFKGRLHMQCQNPCKRTLVCGHICKDVCSFCPPCNDVCINQCKHNRCPNICGEACIPCNMQCMWRCKHYVCTKRCSEDCDRERCNEPCKKYLNCEHLCIGLCGETCPKICRDCNPAIIEENHIWGWENVKTSRYILLEDCDHLFEVSGMDEYMATRDSEEDETVSMKRCPHCVSSIVTTPRYGNIAKQSLRDIQIVKRKIMGDTVRISILKKRIDEKMRRSEQIKQFAKSLGYEDMKSEHKLASIASQISIFEMVTSLRLQIDNTKRRLDLKDDHFKRVIRFLDEFMSWTITKRSVLSTQEQNDATKEVGRLQGLVKLSIGRERASNRLDKVPAIFMTRLASFIRDIENNQSVSARDIEDMLETLKEYVPESTLGVTNEERLQIVQAIGGRKGHWYQCRNGHYYSIGECGRPLEIAKCPECSQAIGGVNHDLVGGNIQAPEMDDAEEPLHTAESDFRFALQLQFGT